MTAKKPPATAFILAAGFGRRMLPLTECMPKPMVPVHGRPVIDHILDHLEVAGVQHVNVNTHHLAGVLEDHIAPHKNPAVKIFREDKLLDTGGGLKNMLQHYKGDTIVTINGDAYWTDGPSGNVFNRLATLWDPSKMDMLSLLQPVAAMKLTEGCGDYDLHKNGLVERRRDKKGAHMWTSIRFCAHSLFENTPPVGTPFSFLEQMDLAQQNGRHFGVVHDGAWHHISTPRDLARVNEAGE